MAAFVNFFRTSKYFFEKDLTNPRIVVYNSRCHFVNSGLPRKLTAKRPVNKPKEVSKNAQNLPAEEAPEKDGARIPQENEDR